MRPLRILAGVTAVGVLGVSAVLSVGVNATTSSITTVHLPSKLEKTEPDVPVGSGFAPTNKPVNILLLGSDARTGKGNAKYGNPEEFDTARADTTILVHLPAGRQWVSMVSIPRDLVVDLPTNLKTCGDKASATRTRINEAFTIGGPACTVAAVEKVTGVPIDHVVSIDFTGFVKAIDHMGGLKVCLKTPVHDEDADLNLKAGTHTVDGKTALGLVRVRKAVSDGSDISRTARQQYIIRLLVNQTKETILKDPWGTWKVINDISESLTTDAALADAHTILDAVAQLSGVGNDRFYTYTLPWLPDPQAPDVTVVPNETEMKTLMSKLVNDVEPVTEVKKGKKNTTPAPVADPTHIDVKKAGVDDVFC